MRSIFVLTTLFVNFAYGANILILHPIYCGSHELVLRNLGDYLVKRGHQVTQVSRHTFIQVKLQNHHCNCRFGSVKRIHI